MLCKWLFLKITVIKGSAPIRGPRVRPVCRMSSKIDPLFRLNLTHPNDLSACQGQTPLKSELHNTWGSTESGGAVFLNVSRHQDKIGSIGKPLEHIAIKVLDAENHEMENTDASNAGRMALKGDMQMAGYWDMSEQTADAIQDGWLVTNDLVYLDDDGYVYMLGRADDIINVGGEKVSPVEVENVASEYDGIKECACIGVKDTEGVLGRYRFFTLFHFRHMTKENWYISSQSVWRSTSFHKSMYLSMNFPETE